ncbi:MAG: amidohydrolase family protein [Desulfomonilaceae bacterium]
MTAKLIKNIGTIVTGDITNPIIKGDAILIQDGKIAAIGSSHELVKESVETTIDAGQSTVTPGLIDSHCHVVLGDYSPRQHQIGFLESETHGGVTTIISAGEVHLQGRPKDPAGTKALAILAAKAFSNFRPGGAKVIGGALILEKGLKESDFEEMSREGVRIVGEIGLGSVKFAQDAVPMVQWAKKYGMTVLMHTGGTSIPGSDTVTADQVISVDPHVACHVNGGPTSVSIEEIEKLVTQTAYALELVHCGNMKSLVDAVNLGIRHNALHRYIIGNDAPSGTGIVPLGILRVISTASSLTPLEPEKAICMATGNTAKVFKLNCGFVGEGYPADLTIMDAPMGSVGKTALDAIKSGDVPGVSMVIIEGEIKVNISRNTPPAARKAKISS